MAKRLIVLLLPAALALSACGESVGERAATGGGVGAAAGAITGLLLPGISWWGGALIGGLGGAAIGAATTEKKQ
jgi:hypothetical protein